MPVISPEEIIINGSILTKHIYFLKQLINIHILNIQDTFSPLLKRNTCENELKNQIHFLDQY